MTIKIIVRSLVSVQHYDMISIYLSENTFLATFLTGLGYKHAATITVKLVLRGGGLCRKLGVRTVMENLEVMEF